MQLDMKNAFLQSKLDRVLYMYQSDNFDDGTSRVGNDGVNCWVLVYVNDRLAASSSTAMLKELKELLEAAFELREFSPVVKYLGLEIVRDRPARKLWLHQQNYADKLRRRFIDEEQGERIPRTPVSFAATTTWPDIAFACIKLGSGLMVRSDQYWREVDRCLAYLADTHDTALEFGGGPESLDLIGYVDANNAVKCALDRASASSARRSPRPSRSTSRPRTPARRGVDFSSSLQNSSCSTIFHVDNKSAITVAEGLGLMGNLKHMEQCYAWLQHMVRRGKFVLKYIPTTEQRTDFLTKALHFPAFNRCSITIGHVCLADVGDGDDDVQQ
ncbi:unnamed protein product [Closterium sp. NIES-53]